MNNFQKEIIGPALSDPFLKTFILENLENSLQSIFFSNALTDDLLSDLENLDVDWFGEKWKEELKTVYAIGFFQNLVPRYFKDYVVPVTPAANKLIDIGCGTGILAKTYGAVANIHHVIGIDINAYPEWETFKNNKITFKVISEAGILKFLTEEAPDILVLTWTLHHMTYDEQERYLGYMWNVLPCGAAIVILEDSYSDKLSPETGAERHATFHSLTPNQRKNVMSVFDWLANRVLAQRRYVPMPCAYRNAEEWIRLFEKKGFDIVSSRYIGFPENRDINTPQSLFVIAKAEYKSDLS